ncbi:hypothetical protein HY469_04830, partial [Candidatus Roizmanbacteria bacterium]|nr:hypothetical protein [Candidatus Roizmanbacteria bacterium]
KKLFQKISIATSLLGAHLMAGTVFAESHIPTNEPLGVTEAPTGVISSINSLISGGVTLILIVAGLVAFVYLLLGGIKWITSGGDSGQVEAARNQVIHALIGIIVVLAAWGLIMLIQGATGACFGIGCTVTLPVFN